MVEVERVVDYLVEGEVKGERFRRRWREGRGREN